MSSADDSMELEYGLPATQPVHIAFGNRRPSTRIGWQDSQPTSQNPFASLMSGADSTRLFFEHTYEAAPEPVIPLPSTSAAPAHKPARAERRRRKGRATDEAAPAPAKQSAVLDALDKFESLLPDQAAFSRPQTAAKENQNQRALKAVTRAHERCDSGEMSTGLRTPPNDTSESDASFGWAPRAGAAAGSLRTRSLVHGQARAAPSLAARHQSLPQLDSAPPALDVTMSTDVYSIRDRSAASDFDSPVSVGKGAFSSPEADDSLRLRRASSSQTSLHSYQGSPHSLPDTSRLSGSGSSQAVLAGLQLDSSCASASALSARASSRVASPSSSTTVLMQDATATPTSTSSSSAREPRGLKRTGSYTPMSRDRIKSLLHVPPPPAPARESSPLQRAPAARPQHQTPSTSRAPHAPSATQRSKALGMRNVRKPYEPPPPKRRSPQAARGAPAHRIGGFKAPLIKTEPAPPAPLGNRSVQPVHAARAQAQPRAPPPPPPPPPRAQKQKQKREESEDEDEDGEESGKCDASYGDISLDIDMKDLDEVMGQYD